MFFICPYEVFTILNNFILSLLHLFILSFEKKHGHTLLNKHHLDNSYFELIFGNEEQSNNNKTEKSDKMPNTIDMPLLFHSHFGLTFF